MHTCFCGLGVSCSWAGNCSCLAPHQDKQPTLLVMWPVKATWKEATVIKIISLYRRGSNVIHTELPKTSRGTLMPGSSWHAHSGPKDHIYIFWRIFDGSHLMFMASCILNNLLQIFPVEAVLYLIWYSEGGMWRAECRLMVGLLHCCGQQRCSGNLCGSGQITDSHRPLFHGDGMIRLVDLWRPVIIPRAALVLLSRRKW